MADAAMVALAKAVTDSLNAKQGGWSKQFTAERVYKPTEILEETEQIKVRVALSTWESSPDNRTDWAETYGIDIGIQYRPKPNAGQDALTHFDDCMKLQEEMHDHFSAAIGSLRIVDCVLTDIEFGGGTGAAYVSPHMMESNQFTGVVRLTFTKWR